MTPLPHDINLERAVLAAIILRPDVAGQVTYLGPLSFHLERHRLIFRAIVDCFCESGTVDLRLIVSKLNESDQLARAGGVAYLSGLLDDGAVSVNVAAYGARLRDYENRRAAIIGADQIAALAREQSASVVTAALSATAEKLSRKTSDAAAIRSINVSEAIEGHLPDIPWLAEGWIGQGDLVVLAGEWATGKSLIALDLALAVCTGQRWMGTIPCPAPGPVLYLDEENPQRNASRRIGRMARGRDVSDAPLRYLTQNGLNLDDRSSYDLVRREVESLKPAMIVMDAAIRFHNRDENKASQMAPWFRDRVRPLQTINGSCVVLIDHMSKPTADSKDFDPAHRVRGSGDKLGVVDVGLTLEGDRGTDKRLLSASKVRWLDDLPSPLETRWRRSEDESAAWIEATDANRSGETTLRHILEQAGAEGIRSNELLDRLEHAGIPRRTAHYQIKRGVAAGWIIKRSEGNKGIRYWLAGVERRETW